VLEAFQTHRLVGLGEVHDLQNHGDAVALLLSDLRLAGVEFGNALYQDVNGQVAVPGGGQLKVPTPRVDHFSFRAVPPRARAWRMR